MSSPDLHDLLRADAEGRRLRVAPARSGAAGEDRPEQGPGRIRLPRRRPGREPRPAQDDAGRRDGSGFLSAATFGLAVQAAGLMYVSYQAQYNFILSQKPGQKIASVIEAGMLDTGMVIFSLAALGLSMIGKPARVTRAWIVICALGSSWMNYAASHTENWRSVAVYVIAPLFLAVVTDRVIAEVRRHVLGDDEPSVWAAVGRVFRRLGRGFGLVLLYLLRFALAFPSTWGGMRRWVLATARVPAPPSAEGIGDVPPEMVTAVTRFYDHIMAGTVPAIRDAKKTLGCSQENAKPVLAWVEALGLAVTSSGEAA